MTPIATVLVPALIVWACTGASTGSSDSGSTADSAPADSGCSDVDTTDHTVGLLACEPGGGTGYTLVAPLESTTTFLVDAWGRVVHTWASAHQPGNSTILLDDGSLLRPAIDEGHPVFQRGGAAGRLQRLSWEGELTWDVALETSNSINHHDVAPLPDGDVLVLIWERWTEAEALAAGRDPSTLGSQGLWVEVVQQLTPTGADTYGVAWTWRVADHFVQDFDAAAPDFGVVSERPGRVDLNPPGAIFPDFIHLNAIDHDPVHDRIVLSSLGYSEAWVIARGASTEESAGPAGDLLYRWGNPQSYGDYGGHDQVLHGQHDVTWLGEDRLLVFDNGPPGQTGPLSRAMEWALPLDEGGEFSGFDGRWGPEDFAWAWPEPPRGEIASDQLGGAQRLDNGNTLVCEGEHGRVVEVTSEGEVVWEWVNPVTADGAVPQGEVPEQGTAVRANALFRARRVPADHPALVGRELTPGVLLEEWVAES